MTTPEQPTKKTSMSEKDLGIPQEPWTGKEIDVAYIRFENKLLKEENARLRKMQRVNIDYLVKHLDRMMELANKL